MLLYHASPTAGITVLEPRVSNHGRPLVYLADCREHVLVYLGNPVEKFCREAGIIRPSYYKFASYGFTKEGVLHLDEYWPNATEETFRGVSGYIYSFQGTEGLEPLPDIPHAYVSSVPLPVSSCEFIPDAYEALKKAEVEGKLVLRSYAENSEKTLRWLREVGRQEYEQSADMPYYREFLKAKFPYLRDIK